ncbi:olfactory receptor 5AR1-like [Hyperolius riggenbachi]|uniref:olfactory receptor 5AR1-like n=1 Tax=Hyperolius riggenbachi TaxID=752182 RepID=UPI0035A30E2E
MNQCQNITLKGFNIVAFSTSTSLTIGLFTGALVMYLIAVTGNLIITTVICKVSRLHSPMYWLLCNLSLVEALYISNILPKLLSIMLKEDKTISFQGCITQLFFFIMTGDAEVFLLTCMAYDRYVAICYPLHYSLVMRKQVCVGMVFCSLFVSFVNSLMFTLLTYTVRFCYTHRINHFFCEIRSLLAISSSNTASREVILFVEDFLLVSLTFLLILTSYGHIISTVLKVHSLKGRLKTFSSCSSHLTAVMLFYGPIIFLYIKPKSEDSEDQDKLLSLLYVAVVPTLNPFVYTLRNKEVIEAVRQVFRIKCSGSFRFRF